MAFAIDVVFLTGCFRFMGAVVFGQAKASRGDMSEHFGCNQGTQVHFLPFSVCIMVVISKGLPNACHTWSFSLGIVLREFRWNGRGSIVRIFFSKFGKVLWQIVCTHYVLQTHGCPHFFVNANVSVNIAIFVSFFQRRLQHQPLPQPKHETTQGTVFASHPNTFLLQRPVFVLWLQCA